MFGVSIFRREEGHFTLEGVMMMPVIFLVSLGVLLLFVGLYRTSNLQFIALQAAERTAFVWDNSHKDLTHGENPSGLADNLYWRMTDDRVGDWFSWLTNRPPVEVALPLSRAASSGSLPAIKLTYGAMGLPDHLSGKMTYANSGIQRKVQVQLTDQGFRVPFPGGGKFMQPSARGEAVVVDPAEWIRTVDFIRSAVPELKKRITKQEAAQIMPESTSTFVSSKPVSIQSEAEAAEYVRGLVGGTKKVISMGVERKSRVIDALDADGMAHEVKYTVNTQQVLEEISKDMELIKQGKVKGVVWHFFINQKTGRSGLTKKVRSALERSGIVYVEHG